MSFSVVAVAVLIMASAAGAYFAKREIENAEDAKRDMLLALMESSIEEVRVELSLLACAEAYGIVSGWDEFPVNETRISSEFSSAVKAYLDNTFPREQSGFSLSVSNWSGGLFFVEKRTMDISSPDQPEAASIELDGTEMEYESMPPPTTDELAVTTANPYYMALGNMSVVAESESVSLSKDISFDRPVISALPLLETKMRTFEAASEGEFSDMGRLVAYMLNTLAQLRTLEGHGIPTYTDLDTSSILTETDVYRAVAVSLLIEQARLFRDLDGSFLSEVAAECGGGELGIAALSGGLSLGQIVHRLQGIPTTGHLGRFRKEALDKVASTVRSQVVIKQTIEHVQQLIKEEKLAEARRVVAQRQPRARPGRGASTSPAAAARRGRWRMRRRWRQHSPRAATRRCAGSPGRCAGSS